MTEINDYLWETIYVLKSVYDHDQDAPVLNMYRDSVIDGDYVGEIAYNSINQFFADTRGYYDEEKELDIHVFFDPVITEFWKLCDEYEEHRRLRPEDNTFRKEMCRALDAALYIPDYSYDFRLYSDTKHKNGCRLVLLCYCEFCGYHYIPEALSEASDCFVFHTKKIKAALAEMDRQKVIELPSGQRKKAA